MRTYHKAIAAVGAVASIVAGLSQVSAQDWTPPPLAAVRGTGAGTAPTVSVMTYNVEGLPFPVRIGRDAAAARIAQRLREMRRRGVQPDVVVLQEAFGPAQRAIGHAAGYRYIAFGPDAGAVGDTSMTVHDRRFAAAARFSRGELSGKLFGSGLVILSDYPIERVARAAFPAFACAGFDCLANKGVMLAMVRVPGAPHPVAIVTLHMNSKKASHVPVARRDYAFARQVDAVGQFLRRHLPSDVPYVLAGDTNIGGSAARRVRFRAMLASLARSGAGRFGTALDTCLGGRSTCTVTGVADLRRAHAAGKDWEVYAPGAATALAPVAADASFGTDASGRMLSDHVGYVARYRLVAATATPLEVAGR
jgi:endonuclease/exonuclease/phosphatase family metal-dependent hydrolase